MRSRGRFVAPLARDYAASRIPTATGQADFRGWWMRVAMRAFETEYGELRVLRHRARLEDALGAVYADIYASTQEAA